MAKQAISSLSVFTLFCKESPVYWNSSWISKNGSAHTPEQKGEQQVKYYEENNIWGWLERKHVLVYEDEVVESDEAAYPDKMWIYQLSAIHNLYS